MSVTERDCIAEARALLHYGCEQGLLSGTNRSEGEALHVDLVIPLTEAIERAEASPGSFADEVALLSQYARLRRITGNVSGRSILDSANAFTELSWIVLVTFATGLVTAVSIAKLTFNSVAASGSLWPYIAVAAGGAFGSSLFLLKRIYDLVRVQGFLKREFSAVYSRVALGAALALTFFLLFDTTYGQDNKTLAFDTRWGAYAIIIGLSIKVFYGVLESIVEMLADRFRLSMTKTLRKEDALATRQPEAVVQTPTKPVPDTPVSRLQNRLIAYGRLVAPATGVLDDETVQAASELVGIEPPASIKDFDTETVLALLDGIDGEGRGSGVALERTEDHEVVAAWLTKHGYADLRPESPDLVRALEDVLIDLPSAVAEKFGDRSLTEVAAAIRSGEIS